VSSEAIREIVKAYDVRGLVATQLTPAVAYALGFGAVEELKLAGQGFLIGHDMRPSSPDLAWAIASGAADAGAEVEVLGLASTDMVYYASGALNAAAAMVTASHNPAEYNGIKFSRAGAQGVSLNTGLAGIRDRAVEVWESTPEPRLRQFPVGRNDLLADYAGYLRSLVGIDSSPGLTIVVDAANGMAGYTVPAVFGTSAGLEPLPIAVIPLYFELDGTFPHHEANPLEPKNLVDLQAAVLAHRADLGLAFDGDADRCFVVDERGQAVSPSVVGALVAKREIGRARALGESEPTVLHNLICSRVVEDTIAAEGATAVRTPVGHSLIKDEMARTGAIFGAEHSAHYYFRDFFGADNGMLAALHVLAERQSSSESMSALAARFSPYLQSGEINSRVANPHATLQAIEEAFGGRGTIDRLDGVSVLGPSSGGEMWWLNVRASNTEPLVRLNVEAANAALLEKLTTEALAVIRG
jgi:phosphomannomutase